MNDLSSYYRERAKEYDKVYLNPAEQEDLLSATTYFQLVFSNKNVLEIACGTGYWTAQIAKTATSIFATDINQNVLDIAKAKGMPGNVTFELADMYSLSTDKQFDGAFGGFIWSHILRQDLDQFLDKIAGLLYPRATLTFIDSKLVAGTSHDEKRITRMDEQGNTYQTRHLDNGATHEVLKNYPTKDFLYQKLSRLTTDIDFVNLEHYWIASCRLK